MLILIFQIIILYNNRKGIQIAVKIMHIFCKKIKMLFMEVLVKFKIG